MNNQRCSLTLKFVILLLLIGANHGNPDKRPRVDCQIRVDGLGKTQPLILEANKQAFSYPSKDGILFVSFNEAIRIACPGDKNHFTGGIPAFNDDMLVTCEDNNVFRLPDSRDKHSNVSRTFNSFSCANMPSATVKQTYVKCGDGELFQIGFSINHKQRGKEFLQLIDLCYDARIGKTLWAHAKIYSADNSVQKTVPNPSYFRTVHAVKDIDNFYKQDMQVDALKRLLGKKVVKVEGDYYFARGHLIANADFVYGSHQYATYYYLNVVPMWQKINNGNWKLMETSVRTLSREKNLHFDVWAGGYEILQLKNSSEQYREIYLHINKNTNVRTVPVPKILFKVVYHQQTNSGIVFLTANNPYLKQLPNDYKICEDVCDKINYIKWKPTMGDRGLSYCCEVDEFISKATKLRIPQIPTTKKILFPKNK